MKKQFLVLLFAIAALYAQSQTTINDANAEVRKVSSSFNAIKVSHSIDLYLTQSNDEAIAVSATESKYRDRIKTEVQNGVLRIWFDDESWRLLSNQGNKKLKAYVSFKSINKLTASGASDVYVTGVIKADQFTLDLSGASDFKGAIDVNVLDLEQSGASDADITGSARTVNAEASGASDLKGYNLVSDNCTAHASGASDIKITVNKELSAKATGASGIHYKGNAVIKEIKSSGASSISKRS